MPEVDGFREETGVGCWPDLPLLMLLRLLLLPELALFLLRLVACCCCLEADFSLRADVRVWPTDNLEDREVTEDTDESDAAPGEAILLCG